MAENNSKPDNKAKNMPDMEQPVTDPKTEAQIETSTAAPRKKRRLGPWLFLLLIFVGLPAAWFLSPPDIRLQARHAIDQIISRSGLIQHNTNASTPNGSMAPGVESIASSLEQTDATSTEGTQAGGDVSAGQSDTPLLPGDSDSSPASEPISSAPLTRLLEADSVADASELDHLRKTIEQLQSHLRTALTERDALGSQLLASQQEALKSRLQWISRPDTRLTQRAELWKEIVSWPNLGEEGKGKAKLMARLAGDSLVLIEEWRLALSKLAESIPDTQQADIIPKPENPYLAWLIGTFHLRPAPGKSDLMQNDLRRQLMHMEHALSREDWPEENEWRALITKLHEQFGADADLSLPESLLPALREMGLLRETANSWLEAL